MAWKKRTYLTTSTWASCSARCAFNVPQLGWQLIESDQNESLARFVMNANGRLDAPLAWVVAKSAVAVVASSTASVVSSLEPPYCCIPLLHLPVYENQSVEVTWHTSCLPKTHQICSCSCDLLCSLHGLLCRLCGLRGLIHSLCGLLRSVDFDTIMMYLNHAKRDCSWMSEICWEENPFRWVDGGPAVGPSTCWWSTNAFWVCKL